MPFSVDLKSTSIVLFIFFFGGTISREHYHFDILPYSLLFKVILFVQQS